MSEKSGDKLNALRAALVNTPIDHAREQARLYGWTIRVRKQDGKNCVGTCDVKPNRINVEVANGVVTEVTGLG